MLILTRKDNESLFIGDDIKITVLSVKGNQVRIESEENSNSSSKSTLSLNKPI